jgi:hypothetical protein
MYRTVRIRRKRKNFYHREEGEEGGGKRKKLGFFYHRDGKPQRNFMTFSLWFPVSVVKFFFFLPPLPLLCGENSSSFFLFIRLRGDRGRLGVVLSGWGGASCATLLLRSDARAHA